MYWFNPKYLATDAKVLFSDCQRACQVRGKIVTKSPQSQVYYYQSEGQPGYYIKTYHLAGKKLRRYVGRSRNRAEWDNLKYFKSLGINTPEVVAFGEIRRLRIFKHGVLITEALDNTVDLATLDSTMLANKVWLHRIIKKIASYTQRLHQTGFIHNDLKWRNILVDKSASNDNAYFIDCPVGRKRYFYCRWRGIVKDLACLDKVARDRLSRTDRLRFYLHYIGRDTLSSRDKKQIKKIVHYFKGRT